MHKYSLNEYAKQTNAYLSFFAMHPNKGRAFKMASIQGSTADLDAKYLPKAGKEPRQSAMFYAFVNDFDESFASSWDAQQYYGKTDAIVGFKNTKRTISLSWKTPAADLDAAKDVYKNLNSLATMLYPTYLGVNAIAEAAPNPHKKDTNDWNDLVESVKTIYRAPASRPLAKPPIIGVSWGNLIANRDPNYDAAPTFAPMGAMPSHSPDAPNPTYYLTEARALICHVENFALAPAVENGYFSDAGKLYPRIWNCSINLTVQHTHALGRQARSW